MRDATTVVMISNSRCMLVFYLRERMNLKAPIFFSTGLTEKVWAISVTKQTEIKFKVHGLSCHSSDCTSFCLQYFMF